MINLDKFKAAAVQAAPVYLDAEGTVDKACQLIGDAATANPIRGYCSEATRGGL